MQRTLRHLLPALLLTGCLGQGKRQTQRLERIYGMPLRDILATEKPRQILQYRRAGEPIQNAESNRKPLQQDAKLPSQGFLKTSPYSATTDATPCV